mmetsp:Transcript_11520/g.40228  ORF Transcript_11520/g.40228 Transcript_11520/m.40228 type:complete len:209 (-) Transcript_11520:2678-3304(-)
MSTASVAAVCKAIHKQPEGVFSSFDAAHLTRMPSRGIRVTGIAGSGNSQGSATSVRSRRRRCLSRWPVSSCMPGRADSTNVCPDCVCADGRCVAPVQQESEQSICNTAFAILEGGDAATRRQRTAQVAEGTSCSGTILGAQQPRANVAQLAQDAADRRVGSDRAVPARGIRCRWFRRLSGPMSIQDLLRAKSSIASHEADNFVPGRLR